MKLTLLVATAASFVCFEPCGLAGPGPSNLLGDPGFESGTFLPNSSGLGGWSQLASAAFSQDYAHSGSWSLKDAYDGSSFVIGGVQLVPVTPQASYAVSGWGFTPSPSTFTGIGQGFLMVTFLNGNGQIIDSGGTAFYPMGSINGSTPAMTWTLLSGTVTAPPTAVSLEVIPELFSGSAGNVVYYDDISVTVVPEPSELALLLGLGLWRLLTKVSGRRRPTTCSSPKCW